MSDHKILPLAEPPVIAFQHHGFPLAILATRDGYLPWFFSNYIQLQCPRRLRDMDQLSDLIIELYGGPFHGNVISPWLDIQRIDRDLIPDLKTNLISFLKDCIDHEYYVQLTVDEYFVTGAKFWKIKHEMHEVLIFGYEENTQQLHILGFQTNGDFKPYTISYADLEFAFRVSQKKSWDLHGIRLFGYKQNVEYQFDVQVIIDLLEDYLNCRNTSLRFAILENPAQGTFGIDNYDCLKEFFEYLRADKIHLDFRQIQIMWEHKKCMCQRIRYLEQNGFLNTSSAEFLFKEFSDIEHKVRTFRMMYLKYSIKQDKKLLNRIIDKLNDVKRQEYQLIGAFIKALKQRKKEM